MEASPMQAGSWFSLAQYSFILALAFASALIVCFALALLHILRNQRNFECSPALLVFLVSLMICCFGLTGQYAVLLLFSAIPGPISQTQLIFWSGLFPGSLLPATPISVLFLSLDRLLIVLLPSLYMRKLTKLGLAAASGAAILGLFALNLAVNLAQRPTKEVPECISFGCLTSDASRLIYAVNRLAVALPNFLAGSAFLAVLFAYRRRVEKSAGPHGGGNKSRKMGDRLALWVVLFEFSLDLVPNMGNFVLTTFTTINISVYVGAFRSITYTLCAFAAALAHTAVLWRVFASKKGTNGGRSVAPGTLGPAKSQWARRVTDNGERQQRQSARLNAEENSNFSTSNMNRDFTTKSFS